MATRSTATHGSAWYRGDITGLRTLAIVPVVAFHAGLEFLPGGFVGVDIFYVISGFLITTLLVREINSTGRVALWTFWAKRVRRLVPALALVVAISLPILTLITSPLDWRELGKSAGAALLYVSNFVFALSSTDYFDQSAIPNPYLHTWSLGVEEQFYVVWPLILIVAIALVRRRPALRVAAIRIALAAVAIISFGISIAATPREPMLTFYLLPSRAWEFAIAGLIATLPIGAIVRHRIVSDLFALCGVALLVVSFLTIDELDPFPGSLALMPVVGTLLILIGGTTSSNDSQGMLARVLATAPMQWIGNVSYSWYLWHWPFIIAALIIFPESTTATLVAGVMSLGAAWLTFRFVENPLRFHRKLRGSLPRSYAFGGAVTVSVGILAAVILVAGSTLQDSSRYAPYADARAEVPPRQCDGDTIAVDGVKACAYGDVNASTTVLMAGDSHVGQWIRAFDAVASKRGIRVVVSWTGACPANGLLTVRLNGQVNHGCPEFQAATLALADSLQPDAVVLGQAATYRDRIVGEDGEPITNDAQFDKWRNAQERMLAAYDDVTPNVGMLIDNPRFAFDPIDCNTRVISFTSCAEPAATTLARNARLNDIVAAANADAGVDITFSVADRVCDEQVCRTVSKDGTPMYRDPHHLSEDWTLMQSDRIETFLSKLVTAA